MRAVPRLEISAARPREQVRPPPALLARSCRSKMAAVVTTDTFGARSVVLVAGAFMATDADADAHQDKVTPANREISQCERHGVGGVGEP